MDPETIYDFEWDPAKALHNARKHGVTFEQAATVFLDALALTSTMNRTVRKKTAGSRSALTTSGRLLAVAHTYGVIGAGNVRVRIISARNATPRERRYYEEEPR